MSKITEEEIQKILPVKGPSFEEVKNYLDKYNDEYVVIKCGGSILVDKSYEIDAIMDETVDTYENKDKAALILAQIQNKIHSK